MLTQILIILITFVFSATTLFAQTDLPDRGELSDIKDNNKLYISASAEKYNAIKKRILKSELFEIADKSENAEIFLEYKTISRQSFGFGGTTETGQINVYIYRKEKKLIVWSKEKTGGGYKADTAKKLIKLFLKDYKKHTRTISSL